MIQHSHTCISRYRPQELKVGFCKDACTFQLIAALYTIAPKWKQCQCPSRQEWIRCGIYIQWNIIQPSTETELWHRLHLENRMPSDRSQSQRRHTLCDSTYLKFLELSVTFIATAREGWLPGARGERNGNYCLTEVSVLQDGKNSRDGWW